MIVIKFANSTIFYDANGFSAIAASIVHQDGCLIFESSLGKMYYGIRTTTPEIFLIRLQLLAQDLQNYYNKI